MYCLFSTVVAGSRTSALQIKFPQKICLYAFDPLHVSVDEGDS